MGRRGLPGCGQALGEQGLRRRLAGGDEAGQASPARSGRRRGDGREAQGIGAGEGGTSVLECEAALRVRYGALPGTGEEHASHRVAARVLESAHRWPLRDRITRGPCAARGREPDKSKRLPDGSDRFSGAPANTSSLREAFEPDLRTATDCVPPKMEVVQTFFNLAPLISLDSSIGEKPGSRGTGGCECLQELESPE